MQRQKIKAVYVARVKVSVKHYFLSDRRFVEHPDVTTK